MKSVLCLLSSVSSATDSKLTGSFSLWRRRDPFVLKELDFLEQKLKVINSREIQKVNAFSLFCHSLRESTYSCEILWVSSAQSSLQCG